MYAIEVSSFSSAVVHCVHLYRNIDFTSDESLHASLGSALLMMDSVCQLASLIYSRKSVMLSWKPIYVCWHPFYLYCTENSFKM